MDKERNRSELRVVSMMYDRTDCAAGPVKRSRGAGKGKMRAVQVYVRLILARLLALSSGPAEWARRDPASHALVKARL